MPDVYEPLQQVRKSFQVNWYRCPIEPAKLRELTSRSDLQGFAQTLGFLLLLSVTGLCTWLFFDHGVWIAFALALFSWSNPHDFKISHTYHHLYTLHPRGDREVVLPTKPSLHPLHLLQLLTLNVVGGR